MNNLNDLENDYLDIDIHAEETSSYLPAPAGTHIARCVSFIQLGTQKQEYNSIPGKDRAKIVIGWELPEELHVFDEAKGEQPFCIANTYNLVLGEKSTFKIHMQSWTGGKINKEFNPLIMVGKPCTLTIEHRPKVSDPDKITAKVISVTGLTRNQTCPDQVNATKVLLFQRWNQVLFEKQPDWIKKNIEASPEYKALNLQHTKGNNEGVFQKKHISDATQTKIPPATEGLNNDGLPF